MKPEIWIEHIKTTVEGQEIAGTVYHHGATDIQVLINHPFDGYNTGLHIPYFGRSAHPDGFEGKYGKEKALSLLKELYLKHRDCRCCNEWEEHNEAER